MENEITTKDKIAMGVILGTFAASVGALTIGLDKNDPREVQKTSLEILQTDAINIRSVPVQVKDGVILDSDSKLNSLKQRQLPPNAEVNVYQNKNGWGYEIVQVSTTTNPDGSVSTLRRTVGYGPEAHDRTTDWIEINRISATDLASTTKKR